MSNWVVDVVVLSFSSFLFLVLMYITHTYKYVHKTQKFVVDKSCML